MAQHTPAASRRYAKDLLRSLPILASMLGDKHNIRITVGGSSAHAKVDENGRRTINIPEMTTDISEERANLIRGYIDHEAGHMRFTDFNLWTRDKLNTNVLKTVTNQIEDYFVEHRMGRLFDGCACNLNWLRKWMANEYKLNHDAFVLQGAKKQFSMDNILNYLFDMMPINKKHANIDLFEENKQMIETHCKGLVTLLDAELADIEYVEKSTQTSYQKAATIQEIIKKYLKDNEGGKGNKEDNKDGSGNPSDKGDPNGKYSKDMTNGGKKALDQLLEEPSMTDDELSDMMRLVRDKLKNEAAKDREDGKFTYSSTGEVGSNGASDDAGDERTIDEFNDITEIQAASNALRVRLRSLLKNKSYDKRYTTDRGKLNTNQLYKIAINNKNIFDRTTMGINVDTAIHILVDSSGSMEGTRMKLASSACYSLALSLSSIKGVNMAVSAFPGYQYTICPILKHGQTLHPKFNIRANGGTPMLEALWYAVKKLVPLKETRKIIILLSDGEPFNGAETKDKIEFFQRRGFEIYGIGIQTKSMESLMENGKNIESLNELAPALFDLIHAKLIC